MKNRKPVTYKDAGVDIDKANSVVDVIKALTKKDIRPGIIGKIGGFSGFFSGRFKGMKEPVLAASTDGVGTKLMLANIAGRHDTVGIDLVAMCANDVIACGAQPLFFLDYYATGRLDSKIMIEVIKGIIEGCRQARCGLIGGETAELPGLYRNKDYDLAGFCVGVADRKDIVDGSKISAGDVVLGISSSGPHSNGYSLIRKLFSKSEIRGRFGRVLLRPTVIYVKPVSAVLKRITLHGIAHITGGGFYDNISRLLPEDRAVVLNAKSWRPPEIFNIIQKRSRLDKENMYRTFNMGIGMALILRRKDAVHAKNILKRFGLNSAIIGEVVKGKRKVII